ncbi:DUF3034 family protein [Pelomonas sp. APW6]|uniref:DUF3034 family protein n=1 Tax=Roseateles subflavus TaxID=3053353 RepID=A0ABT7LEP4_9BURK|nr:DUF3034 family protein [Pelomonas sp. APW6]MDL5031318.1 DUF3034 family protein [Pelomonas sp. APW6]
MSARRPRSPLDSPRRAPRGASLLLAACLAVPGAAVAQGQGKLLLTGGVSSIDGAAGGGLTPWALIGSYAAPGEVGATAFATRLRTQDYGLTVYGAALGLHDRFELSLARQDFATGPTGAALGLPGLHLKQDILGAKWRLAGEAVLDSDRWMPQITLGLEHKRSHAGALAPTLASLGARSSDTELYLSATKLLLRHSTLLSLTLRATRANQNGLLGYGGAASSRYSLQPELSVAYLLNRHLAVGAEYRAKPDKLNPSALGQGLAEQDWKDLYIAWAPSKQFSLTAAWVDLGAIVPGVVPRRQTGLYLSAQIAY